jgi:TonB family protein
MPPTSRSILAAWVLSFACGCDAEESTPHVAAAPPTEPDLPIEEPRPEPPEPPKAATPETATTTGYGRGSGAGFGGRGKRVPAVRSAKAEITGALDREQVRDVVRKHINEVRSCYNAGLTLCPNLNGRVAIEFVIEPNGKVRSAEVLESTHKDTRVPACIAGAVERWRFPKPKDGKPVTVIYPFNLSPG